MINSLFGSRIIVILLSKFIHKVRILFMNSEIKINPLDIIEIYYPVGTEIYQVLVVHSEQVRDKALEIADSHPEFELDKQFLAEAAMLHDIGIYLCDAPRIYCHGINQYIQHGYLGADLLRSEGLDRHALVCERHTGVGLSLETIIKNKLPLPHCEMLPVSLEEQVICYADKFFSKTQLHKIHSIERIHEYLGHYGESEVRKFDYWHSLFE